MVSGSQRSSPRGRRTDRIRGFPPGCGQPAGDGQPLRDDGSVSQSSPPVEVPGHYLERVVGRGATSVVWAGRDPMGRAVAIKVPHKRPDSVDQMQSATERHILTALRHEHLVALRDVVPLPDGRVATVFDLVEGATLRATVDARGQLRPGETVTVLTPVCDAVATLHRAGATHGDISAGNILITADGRPLLADLGSARVAGTGAGVFGTPGFVAPEVRAGERPTEASDVFALGALAWFCLTGNGAPDTSLRLSPETVLSHVGPELAEVVGACIDPEPSLRPPADRLDQLFYSAARAEPIEVVVGADEASALTHRLRMNAAAASPEPQARQRFVTRLLVGLQGRWAGSRRLLAGATLCAALVVAGSLAWSGRVALAGGGRPGPVAPGVEAASTTAARPSGVPSGEASASAGAVPSVAGRGEPSASARVDVTVDPFGPRRVPAELMRALAERRAEVLVRGDATALGRVHRPGSPSWAADAALLSELRSTGQRYAGLGVAAVVAEAVSLSGDRAVVRARVGLTAYEVLDASGNRIRRPAVRGEVLDFTLVRTSQGWRVDAISASRAT